MVPKYGTLFNNHVARCRLGRHTNGTKHSRLYCSDSSHCLPMSQSQFEQLVCIQSVSKSDETLLIAWWHELHYNKVNAFWGRGEPTSDIKKQREDAWRTLLQRHDAERCDFLQCTVTVTSVKSSTISWEKWVPSRRQAHTGGNLATKLKKL